MLPTYLAEIEKFLTVNEECKWGMFQIENCGIVLEN